MYVVIVYAAQSTNNTTQEGNVPQWIAYFTGGLLFLLIMYYCCRKAQFDENLSQPLLGG